MNSSSPIAVVVGLELNGLGVARALNAAGVRVTAFCDRPGNAHRHSRAVHHVVTADGHGAPLMAALRAYRAMLDHDPVLFLTTEDAVSTVAEGRADLSGYRFDMPDSMIVHDLMNKDRFVPLAEAAGLPQPHSVTIRTQADTAAISSIAPPLIVKPAERSARYSTRFRKAYVVDDASSAAQLATEMLDVTPEVIVQQYVPGGDDCIYFCLQYRNAAGQAVASFSGRKTASWPPQVGGTAECVAAPEHGAALFDLTDRFFAQAGFIGMGGVEYKRDPRDGRFYLIEPTVSRTDYQAEVATLNGVNLPYAAWCSALGRPVPQFTPRADRGWRDGGAVASGAQVQRQGSTADGGRWHSVDALFRPDDPLPWLIQQARRVLRKLGWCRSG